jgi:large subunit ribosomal protein L21
MAYALAQISGKQMAIKSGKWFDIDYIKQGNIGDYILLNKILLLKKKGKFQIGKPILKKSIVYAKIIQQVIGKKIKILKTKEKKNYTKTQGHRQVFTRILT